MIHKLEDINWEGYENIPKGGSDEWYTYDHFGKITIQQAQKKIKKSALYYSEDFLWMPIEPFQYYISAYINYLESDDSEYDSDGASSYIRLIEFMCEHHSEFIRPIKEDILNSVKMVSQRQSFYDADISIYGDFLEVEKTIVDRITKET